MKIFLDGRAMLYASDCLTVLDAMKESSVDAVVTDPPYHLLTTVNRFAKTSQDDLTGTSARARSGADGYARLSRGFMGKQWDGGDIAFQPKTWSKVLRVLKPGGYMVAFAAPKCQHRMICAIEDAGFEIRDCLMWIFGSGFPKSLNIGGGRGTALKPAYEPICLARKPLIGTVAANMLAHGTGAINIDGCRIGIEGATKRSHQEPYGEGGRADQGEDQRGRTGHSVISLPLGRWPANVCHDGSPEVLAEFPDSNGQNGVVDGQTSGNEVYGKRGPRPRAVPRADTGSAARFFYSSKATKDDRFGSKHPTVKPISLLRWLVRLITPPNGVVLDPFAGSGTIATAAYREGFYSVLVERETEYISDIERRLIALEQEK